jgi:hypothetical protein
VDRAAARLHAPEGIVAVEPETKRRRTAGTPDAFHPFPAIAAMSGHLPHGDLLGGLLTGVIPSDVRADGWWPHVSLGPLLAHRRCAAQRTRSWTPA